MYHKQISIPELARYLGVESCRVKKVILSMAYSVPIAEDDDGMLTKVEDLPYRGRA
jgi:hypothetical protein